jgi:hypothetical protein
MEWKKATFGLLGTFPVKKIVVKNDFQFNFSGGALLGPFQRLHIGIFQIDP